MINIIIADKNILNIQYMINAVFNKIKNVNIKTFVATTPDEVFNLITDNHIDIILLNFEIEPLYKLNLIPIIIKDFQSNIDKVMESICLMNERNIIKQIDYQLLKLGYNYKLKGTQYLAKTILYIYSKNDMSLLDNLERNVYKQIAEDNNKTINNVKTNISKATDFVYTYQDKQILDDYFSISIKITPKLVISTILNKICNQ